MLSSDERRALAETIAEVEKTTSGEIVCIIARRASDYRSFAIALAAGAALLVPLPLLELTQMSAERVYLIQLLVAVLIGCMLAWLPLRLRLLPRVLGRRRAQEAAHRQFAARGLRETRGRTGVLIYVAVAERYAEVIADEGVAACVDQQVWREAVSDLITDLREGRPASGLQAAVRRIGAVLSAHFPASAADRDELPNHVIEL